MITPKHTTIALYDATSELELYGDQTTAKKAQTLGDTLGPHGFTLMYRSGSSVLQAVASAAHGSHTVVLSPAATGEEHMRAFRLPQSLFPTIYTGRGALGTDVMLTESAHGIIICGSDEEALDGILGCIGPRQLPIAIYTTEDEQVVRERVLERYKELLHHFFVSSDAQELVRRFVEEVRKRHTKDLL